jgi:hypothetical protein
VATERLGIPGDESSRLERRGVVQKKLVYPTRSDQPTATCHLQPDPQEKALCGTSGKGLLRFRGLNPLVTFPATCGVPSAKRLSPKLPTDRLLPQIAGMGCRPCGAMEIVGTRCP